MDGEIKKLNSLRGLAALVVLVAHFSGSTGWLGGYPGKGAGQLGVMVFFVLSGFLMSYLYLHTELGSESLWRYVVARVARVVPLFALVIAVSAVLPRVGVTGVFFDLPNRALLTSHVFLLSGKNILWTIPTELHFYAGFILFWWVSGRSRIVGVMTVMATALLSILSGTPRYRGDVGSLAYDFRLPQVIPYFLSGVLLGVLYRSWRLPSSKQRTWYAVVLVGIPVMYPLVFESIFGFRHGLWNDPLVLVVVSAVFAVVLFAVPDETALLSNPVGDFLGKISYSLYLLHVPVMWAVRKLPLPEDLPLTNSLRFAIFLALSIVVASVVYDRFERPAQRYLRSRLLASPVGSDQVA